MAMTKEELVRYWLDMVEDDKPNIYGMFENGNYVWCMFVQHLNIERTIKAHFADLYGKEAPYIHDLVLLAKKSNVELTEEQYIFLEEMNGYNIEAKYTNYKRKLKKYLTLEITKKNLEKSEEFLEWFLKQTNLSKY